MIVYLHGFNSSPLSGKGRILAAYCAERKISFIAPALHHRPLRAKAEIESLLKSGARVLVGSSLGRLLRNLVLRESSESARGFN